MGPSAARLRHRRATIVREHGQWWQEHGARALMVLDRIGREHIKLSERQADAEVDNARAHVHARLEAALVREEVKMVVRALVVDDRGRFGALSEVGEDRSAELAAVAAVPSWVQQKVSARLARGLGCGEGNDAEFGRLCEALAQGDESRPVSDRLRAAFSEDLQRMREIVAFGDAVGARDQCALPDAIPSDQAVDAASLRAAVENVAAFVGRCNAGTPDIGGGLADALRRAEAPAPSKIGLAQALCEVGVATSQGPAAALGKALREGLAAVLATLADGSSPSVCSALATLPLRRDLSDEEFRTRIDAADDEDAEGLRRARDVISRMGEDAVEALRDRLRELAPRLLPLGRLLFDADDQLQRVPVVPALEAVTNAARIWKWNWCRSGALGDRSFGGRPAGWP